MSPPRLQLIYGHSAQNVLQDHRFLEQWRSLLEQCVHATAFQGSAFVRAWYESYAPEWEPVLVQYWNAEETLIGLWLLAYNPAMHTLANAGTHQAEYHAWLSVPGEDVAFLSAAWRALTSRFKFATLKFKYLPTAALADVLRAVPGMGARVVVQRHARPLLMLDVDDVKASFAKKSNKSRFNRLKKLGKLEFRRLTDSSELEGVLDDLIVFYDFRQGAVNHSIPFREDARKRAFHRRLFAAGSGAAYVTVTFLDDRPIAAFWGMESGGMVHLGMLIHSPLLAEHSPGKLHVMQLSEHLLREGKRVIDLTPGGDPWKERFANGHDAVAEAVIHRSAVTRVHADVQDGLLSLGKRVLARAGITPDGVRSTLAMARRARPAAAVRKLRHWIGEEREFRVYRAERSLAEGYRTDERVRRDCLADLVNFEPGESWQSRDAFLSAALARLERGERVYSISVDGRLAHYGWLALNQTTSYMTEVGQSFDFPPGSVALYDFYSHPDFRGRGFYRATIGHMLRDVFAGEDPRYAYISVLADNLPSRRVIESMGFAYQGSFHWSSRFGQQRTWAGAVFAQAEAADA